jgi:organic radical activating enzyme
MSIKLFDVRWKINTAGPSPYNNERSEVFFFGCERAAKGNPCKGCFNSPLWDSSVAEYTHEPKEIALQIARHAPNKYITIGGGEPTDQMDGLIELCKELKETYDFHIMVYTWKSLKTIVNPILPASVTVEMEYEKNVLSKWKELFQYIDMIVDGEYHEEERLYEDDGTDGTFNSVGSGNQIIWDIKPFNNKKSQGSKKIQGYALRDILQLGIRETDRELVYLLKDDAKPEEVSLWV